MIYPWYRWLSWEGETYDTEAEDARDAKALAIQKLKEACIKHCVIEVIRSAEEKPKRRAASEAKTVIQNQVD